MTDERITQFCVCSEEWCYCTNTTTMTLEDAARGTEWECPECAAGHHVLTLHGPRT